jgi:DNA-binding response OmpR family regulator
MRIGILDDDTNFLGFLSAVLQMAGHTIIPYTTSSSFTSALFPLSQDKSSLRYDLLLLDLHCAETWSGINLFITIRKKISAEQLPIILMIAADEGTFKQWKQLLPNDVLLLRKPFHPSELLQIIAQCRPL